jgi:CubicO group peptidase (beta-lactamase class C family)
MRGFLITTSLILLWIAFVIAIFIAEEWLRQPNLQRGDITSLKNHLVENLQDAPNKKQVGAAALVLIYKGQVAGEFGFGVVNPETGDGPATMESLFFLASVSKAITGWGVMKLVQDGKIGLDEPVMPHLKRWRFPGSERYRDKVTVRHLLTHTSGIVDGFGFGGFGPGEPVQTLEEALEFPKDANMGESHSTVVMHEPGTVMSYSSAGYLVLQLLIEELSGKSFNAYMKEAVFQPLRMTTADYDLDTIIAHGREKDLVPNYDLDLQSQPHRRYANKAGVSLRLSAHDVGLFLSSFYNDNPVLKKETLKEMFTPRPGTYSTWGLSHEILAENGSGGYIVGHGGGAFPRTGASMWVNPDTGNGIAVLMTGGEEMIDPYINDWLYWETGVVRRDVRNVLHRRGSLMVVVILVGSVVIVGLRVMGRRRV